MIVNPVPMGSGHSGRNGIPAAAVFGPHMLEVPIASACGYRLVGFPGARPLYRSGALAHARYRRLHQILSVSPAATAALAGYISDSERRPEPTDPRRLGPRAIPASFSMPPDNIGGLARTAAELLGLGLIGLRGTNEESGIVLPFAGGAARRVSWFGQDTLFRLEAQKGVTERLHLPSGGSGITLGPGYDMGDRDADDVVDDLTAIGVDRTKARQVAETAAGKRGTAAAQSVADNHNLIVLTEPQQRGLLRKILPDYERQTAKGLTSAIRTRLFAHEFDALVLFTYNVGSLAGSSVADAVNRGDFVTAARNFMHYSRSGDKPHLLDSRRQHERMIFERGIYA